MSELYKFRFKQEIYSRRNLIWHILTKYFFQKFINPNSVVVDCACGNGEFINNIKAESKFAFDINPESQNYLNKDIHFVNDTLFNLDKYIKSADYIFCSNVLEHLNNKEELLNAFFAFHKLLKISGKVLILQPNIKYTKGAYWDFIDHKLPLTEKTLIEAANLTGFKATNCIKRFLPYTTKSRFPQYGFLVWLYLKTMPLSGYVFGQQSFLILEKIDE